MYRVKFPIHFPEKVTGSSSNRTKSCSLLGTLAAGDHGEDAVVHAWQDTNDRQDHERIQRNGHERDTSGHLQSNGQGPEVQYKLLVGT